MVGRTAQQLGLRWAALSVRRLGWLLAPMWVQMKGQQLGRLLAWRSARLMVSWSGLH